MDKALDKLIKDNVLQSVQFSDFASPIVPVLKKDNTMRICVDFKYLNTQLNIEKYPLPRLDEILAIVGKK